MSNTKWYEGLSAKEIVIEMSRLYHNSVSSAIQGDKKESETHENEFDKKFKEVIPVIINMKTEFYMHNKDVYNTWNKCKDDLWSIKNSLENDLMKIYLEKA